MTFNQSQVRAIKNVLSVLKVKLENSSVSGADKEIVRKLIEEVEAYSKSLVSKPKPPPITEGMSADEYFRYRTFT